MEKNGRIGPALTPHRGPQQLVRQEDDYHSSELRAGIKKASSRNSEFGSSLGGIRLRRTDAGSRET